MLSRAILKHCVIICGSHILRVSVIHFHCHLAHAGAQRIWCRRSVEQIWHYENTLKCSNNTLMFCEGSAHNKRGNSVPAQPVCLNMEFIVKVFSETTTLMHLCLCLLFLWSQEIRGCKGVWKWSMKKEREGSHFSVSHDIFIVNMTHLPLMSVQGLAGGLCTALMKSQWKRDECARVNKNRMDGRRENERLVLAEHPKQIKSSSKILLSHKNKKMS